MGSHFNILVYRIVCLFKTKSKKKIHIKICESYTLPRVAVIFFVLLLFVSILA